MQLFIPFLNLFIQRLIFNLELFEIDKMETVSKLLFLLQDLFFVCKLISQGDVLESVLMDLLILEGLTFLPLVESLLGNFLSSS